MIQRLYLRIFATTVRLWLIGLRVRLLYGPCKLFAVFFFFFQAEDGIRDIGVTGVQTCALPISRIRCPIPNSLGACTTSAKSTTATTSTLLARFGVYGLQT